MKTRQNQVPWTVAVDTLDGATHQAYGPLPNAAVEAVATAWYFYHMPAKEKAWCGYCILGALVNVGIFALTLPEAGKAFTALRRPQQGMGARPDPQ